MEPSEFKSGSVVKELQDTLRNEVDQMECVIHTQMKEQVALTLHFDLQREHREVLSHSMQATHFADHPTRLDETIATVSATRSHEGHRLAPIRHQRSAAHFHPSDRIV